MRRLLLAAPLLLAACASGQSMQTPDQQPVLPPAVIAYGTIIHVRTVDQVDENLTHSMTVAADPQTLWPLLLQAYRDLGIPVAQLDSSQHVVQSQTFVARRSLLKNGSLDEAFDCGSGISGPNALTHRITVDETSQLVPVDSGHTAVATRLNATASSNEGTSVNSLPCTSEGLLEKRIAILVAGHLATKPATHM